MFRCIGRAAPQDFTIFDNELFFVGTLPVGSGPGGGSLQQTYSTDGTAAGTQNVPVSSGSLYPTALDLVDGQLLASGDGFTGIEGI